MIIIISMGYLDIADELDKDGELRIIADHEYNIYLNEQQARDLIVQIETVFANSGKALFDDSAELAEVKAERDKAKSDLDFYAGKVDEIIAERDALKARLDGGERVYVDKTKKTTSYFYFPTASWQRTNATIIPDEGVEL